MQKKRFAGLLSRLEKKPACKGRSLEIFLTYPMHQVDDDDDADDDDDDDDVDDDISLIAKPDWTDILSRLRSRAISSRCTSCWRTPRPTMSRRTVWSTQGENDIETKIETKGRPQ